jgi:hypothetical protein
MTDMFVQNKRNRIVWRATLAISAGILLGGGAASMESHACVGSERPPTYCLTENPKTRVARGMVSGVFASAGALLMIELWANMQNHQS